MASNSEAVAAKSNEVETLKAEYEAAIEAAKGIPLFSRPEALTRRISDAQDRYYAAVAELEELAG